MNFGRVFYDNIFNFILMVIGLDIVSGIIIDKFASLRENEDEIWLDQTSKCFICGRDRDDIEALENERNGFQGHIDFTHNFLDYIYYTLFLEEKRINLYNDLNDLEQEILNQLDKDDISWIPKIEYYQDIEDNKELVETSKRVTLKVLEHLKSQE